MGKYAEMTFDWHWNKWIATCVARRVAPVEQELPTLLDHLTASPVDSGFRCCSIIFFYYEKKMKQWWSIIPPISTTRTITSHFISLNAKRPQHMTFAIQASVWDRNKNLTG
jgi:hypothetical protein